MILPARLEKENPIKVEFQKDNMLLAKKNRTSLILNRIMDKIRQGFISYEDKENNNTTINVQDLKNDKSRIFREKYMANLETTIRDNCGQMNLYEDREKKEQEEKYL